MMVATFSEFVTTPPLKGLGGSLDLIERIIKDDPQTLALYRAVTVGKHGGSRKQKSTESKNDNIILADSKQGTSKSYTVDRLKREAPHLFDAVVAGNLSANAAAIQAGFRKKPTALESLQRAWAKATDVQRAMFMEWIKG